MSRLERTTRTVAPTPAGEALLPLMRQVLAGIDQIKFGAQSLSGTIAGRLTVGMMEVPSESLDVAALMATFHTRYPEVSVTLRSGGSDLLIDAVRDRKLDVAIVGSNLPSTTGRLTFTELFVESLVAVLPAGHALAGGGAVHLDQLASLPFIDFPPGYGLRHETDRGFANVARRVAFEVTRVDEVIHFVRRDLGVALFRNRSRSRGWATIRHSCCAPWQGPTSTARSISSRPPKRCGQRPRRHSSAASSRHRRGRPVRHLRARRLRHRLAARLHHDPVAVRHQYGDADHGRRQHGRGPDRAGATDRLGQWRRRADHDRRDRPAGRDFPTAWLHIFSQDAEVVSEGMTSTHRGASLCRAGFWLRHVVRGARNRPGNGTSAVSSRAHPDRGRWRLDCGCIFRGGMTGLAAMVTVSLAAYAMICVLIMLSPSTWRAEPRT